jgi:hypothetical protein
MFWLSSPFDALLGPEESKDPIAIEVRERGEYSAESLPDDEYGEGGSCSCCEPEWVSWATACGPSGELDDRWRLRGGCKMGGPASLINGRGAWA